MFVTLRAVCSSELCTNCRLEKVSFAGRNGSKLRSELESLNEENVPNHAIVVPMASICDKCLRTRILSNFHKALAAWANFIMSATTPADRPPLAPVINCRRMAAVTLRLPRNIAPSEGRLGRLSPLSLDPQMTEGRT